MPANRQLDRLRAVSSRQNASIKALRAAFAHGGLTEDGLCALEGVRMIEEAIRGGLKLKTVVFEEHANAPADRLLPQIGAKVETLVVLKEVFRSAVATESPQGVAALAERRTFSLDDLFAGDSPFCVVACGIQDPGNLGTIIRSAEAFAATGIALAEGTVSAWNPKTVRASAGSVLRMPC